MRLGHRGNMVWGAGAGNERDTLPPGDATMAGKTVWLLAVEVQHGSTAPAATDATRYTHIEGWVADKTKADQWVAAQTAQFRGIAEAAVAEAAVAKIKAAHEQTKTQQEANIARNKVRLANEPENKTTIEGYIAGAEKNIKLSAKRSAHQAMIADEAKTIMDDGAWIVSIGTLTQSNKQTGKPIPNYAFSRYKAIEMTVRPAPPSVMAAAGHAPRPTDRRAELLKQTARRA